MLRNARTACKKTPHRTISASIPPFPEADFGCGTEYRERGLKAVIRVFWSGKTNKLRGQWRLSGLFNRSSAFAECPLSRLLGMSTCPREPLALHFRWFKTILLNRN